MQNKKYAFCNCSIEIKHTTPILQKNNYSLFAADFEKGDFSIEVADTEPLPPKTGDCLFSGELNSVYLDGETKKTYSAFPIGSEQISTDFACRINNEKLYISFPYETNEFYVFEGIRLYELLLLKGIGVLHSSFIESNGKAILFAGDTKAGKSTQASLWEKYASATIVNGDRAGVFFEDGKAFAGGVPYCGTSGICLNKQMPINAIICLSQGSKNALKRLSPIEAFMFLLGKFAYNSWDSAAVSAVSDLLTAIVETVPIYSYSCLKDESAVQYLSERI